MMTRTPEEIAADDVMEHIAALHSNPFSTHNTSVLAHLTAMHKLRDRELYEDLVVILEDTDVDDWDDYVMEYWDTIDRLETMQTS